MTSKRIISQTQPTYIVELIVDPRLEAAEKVKRDYTAELEELLAAAEIDLAIALGIDPLSKPTAYQAGELAAYLHRITRPVRRHERALDEAAAQAELAEHGAAWVERVEGGA